MSLEKGGIKNNQANIEKEGKTNIFEKRGKAAKSIWSNFLNNLKTSTILGGALGLSSIASGKENPNAKADDVFLNNKTSKTEISIKNSPESSIKSQKKDTIIIDRFDHINQDNDLSIPLPDGRVMVFNTEEEKEAFLELSKLIKINSPIEIGNGDLYSIYKNRAAERQEKFKEQNVFNSREEAWKAIKKNGWNIHAYIPLQVGNKSPFWNKTGSIPINNMKDYEAHIKENLIQKGFKGELTPEIKYFGFKLEENEFITTLKYNTVVNANVQGGRGYVPLLKGTRVVFERAVLDNGQVCNLIKYILDCKNAIYGDELDIKGLGKVKIRLGVGKNGELETYYAANDGTYTKYIETEYKKVHKKRAKKGTDIEDNDVLQA